MDIDSEDEFDKLTEKAKADYIRNYYNLKQGEQKYVTSPDYNLRELEIDFILSNIKGSKILDLGCGNGYTLMRVAEKFNYDLTGVDFSTEMIKGANQLLIEYGGRLKSRPKYIQGDASTFKPISGKESLSTVISERFLLNLPSEKLQYDVIKNIHQLLEKDGMYIMVEGSHNGLTKLNDIRKIAGLEPILDRDKHNLSSRKFNDDQLEEFLKNLFTIIEIKTFDLYYIISRLVYPRIIYPEQPKYNHEINEIARLLNQYINFPSIGIGHVKGYVLRKI